MAGQQGDDADQRPETVRIDIVNPAKPDGENTSVPLRAVNE